MAGRCGCAHQQPPNGSIWAVGDSRLMLEHLKMPHPDAMLFDFSDSSWHIGLAVFDIAKEAYMEE